MSLNLKSVTFDCKDALALGQFWSAVLGRPLDTSPMPPSPFFASIGMGPDETGNGFMFIQVPEGKTAKNRVHLDLGTDDREAEVNRVIGLGAAHVHDKSEFGLTWTTLTDPEGNEFCIGPDRH